MFSKKEMTLPCVARYKSLVIELVSPSLHTPAITFKADSTSV